ncbi:hypothetical protein ACFLZW_06440 [Chloroflexota bacterium]
MAEKIYQDDPVWAPSSEIMWRQRFRHLYRNPTAFVLLLIALEGGQPVARCMLQLVPEARDEGGNSQGWISFFEFCDGFQEAAKSMLTYGEKILKQQNALSVLIPKSDNQLVGLLTSGFHLPHIVYTNHNPVYYFDFLKSVDYIPKTRMVSLYFTRENVKKMIRLRLPGLRTREFNRQNLEQEINIFHNLQNKIFEGRSGYLPRTYEEDQEMVTSYLPFLEDEFIIIAETKDGSPVGLLACIPDFYQHLDGQQINRARIMSIGAIPGYRRRGIGILMGAHLMKNLVNNHKYEYAEASWILSHNRPPRNLAKRFNARPGREFWLLEKKIT